MNIEQINKIISDYNQLIIQVKRTIWKLEKLDRGEYNTARGIETIDFNDNTILVTCNDSYSGCMDYTCFEFPIIWITKTDEELTELVTIAQELRREKERIRQAERDAKVRLEKEQKELNEYNRLKAKCRL
jgi:hypothetical protein